MSVETLFIIAVVLLILEVFVPSMGLVAFMAFISFVSGIIILLQTQANDFYGVSIHAIIALGCVVFILFSCVGYFLFKTYRKPVETGVEAMINKSVKIKSWNGTEGIVIFEGEEWRAKSNETFDKGDNALIADCTQMTLTLKKH